MSSSLETSRPAVEEDIDEIIRLRARAFSHAAPVHYSKTEVKTLLDDYQRDEFVAMTQARQLFVRVLGARIVGCAGWRSLNIRHVYVEPQCFGRGVGRVLVAQVEDDFRRRTGERRILAGVTVYAKGFYEKLGYVVLDKATAWDGSDYYEMCKTLTD